MPVASSFLPLWDRAAEWRQRLGMIEEARSFLYLSTFYIEWDNYARELLDALERAARRGVEVSLLVDGFGQRLGGVLMTPGDKAALTVRLHALREAGADVRYYRPRHAVQRWVGGGQHIKIQAADTGEVITGSSNLTKTSFEGWNEFSVAVRGPIARMVLESWRLMGDVDPAHLGHLARLEDDRPAMARPSSAGTFDYWCCNPNLHQTVTGPFGWRGRNVVTDRMIDMLDAARTSASITAFYFKPVPALMDAVLRAAGRGVRVEVFHSHRDALPATELAWIAAAAGYRRLLAAGVTIRENRRGEHSKIVLVDDAWAAFGSYNFEDAAHDRLAEAMLATRDAGAVASIRAIIEGLRADAGTETVTSGWAGALSPRLRAKMVCLAPLKRWM
jgi:cardiolipin synthase